MSLTKLSNLTDKPKLKKVAITKGAYVPLVKITAWFKHSFGFPITGEQALRFAMNLYAIPTDEALLMSYKLMKTKRIERVQGYIKVSNITDNLFKVFQTKLMGTQKHAEYVATALLINAAASLPETDKWKSTSDSVSPRRKYPAPLRVRTAL